MMIAYFKFLEINTVGRTLGLALMVRFVFRRLGFCKGFLIVQGLRFGSVLWFMDSLGCRL